MPPFLTGLCDSGRHGLCRTVAATAAGCILPLAFMGTAILATAGFVEPTIADEPIATLAADPAAVPDEQIATWVQELSSDSYMRRKRATTELIRTGQRAVTMLVAQLDSGDLETTERVIGILQEIASRTPIGAKSIAAPDASQAGQTRTDNDVDASDAPVEPSAWAELQRIATLGGSRGSRAKIAAQEVRDVRRAQAVEMLSNAGAFIGVTQFIIGARAEQKRIIEFDDSFSGDDAMLGLLQWVDGIEFARLTGTAIRQEILEGVVQMPDLKTLALVQGEISADELRALGDVAELRRLELRYVPMSGELVDQLATLPIRVSLTLNGTGAPAERVDALQKTVPGLEIIFKQGGFLGVQCYDNFNECLINEVIRGQGADRAGLLPGDVVLAVDGKPVRRFKDLQNAIDAHMPGDKIEIRYERSGTQFDTTAVLGKLAEQ